MRTLGVTDSVATGSNVTAVTAAIEFDYTASGKPEEPMRGLIEVALHGLHRLDLIPKNDLARNILHAMIAADPHLSVTMRGKRDDHAYGRSLEYLSLTLTYRPGYMKGGSDPFWNIRGLSAEQVAQIEAILNPPKPAASASPLAKPISKQLKRRGAK